MTLLLKKSIYVYLYYFLYYNFLNAFAKVSKLQLDDLMQQLGGEF